MFNTTSDENGNKEIQKKRNSFYEKLKTLSLQHPFWQISLLSSRNYVVEDHCFIKSNHWDFDFIGNTHTESYYGYFQVFKHYIYIFFYSNISIKMTDLLFLRCHNICWRTGWKSFRASSMGTISPSRASWWVKNTLQNKDLGKFWGCTWIIKGLPNP